MGRRCRSILLLLSIHKFLADVLVWGVRTPPPGVGMITVVHKEGETVRLALRLPDATEARATNRWGLR